MREDRERERERRSRKNKKHQKKKKIVLVQLLLPQLCVRVCRVSKRNAPEGKRERERDRTGEKTSSSVVTLFFFLMLFPKKKKPFALFILYIFLFTGRRGKYIEGTASSGKKANPNAKKFKLLVRGTQIDLGKQEPLYSGDLRLFHPLPAPQPQLLKVV